MLSTRKPLAQLTTELGLPTSTTEALVAALAEQVRAQLQAEHEAALAQREAEVTAQVAAQVTAEVTARLKAEHFQAMHKLYEQLRLQRRRLFGPSTEANAGQYHLFNEAELVCAEQPEACETASLPPAPTAAPTPKARGKRRPLSPELPRLTLVHELPESERLCPCGTPMVEIGREVSEQLDIIPMQVRVLRHERVRYGCPDKSAAPRTAPPPPQVLPRSNASPNLLAMLLTTKYVDGLPLARFAKIMERHGVTLPRQTQARWVIQVAHQLQPLVNLVQDRLLECRVLHMDETRIQVLKEPGREPSTQSFMWVMCSGAHEAHPLILYDYRSTRSGQIVREKLADWRGHLMADDYAGYNSAQGLPGVVRLTCLAHVRRYFVEASKAQADKTSGLAAEALAHIGALYRLERELDDEGASLSVRHQARQTRGQAAFEQLAQWHQRVAHTVPPSAALGKALAHLGSRP